MDMENALLPVPAASTTRSGDTARDSALSEVPSSKKLAYHQQPVPALSWLGLSVSVPVKQGPRQWLSRLFCAWRGNPRGRGGCLRDSEAGSSAEDDALQFKPLLSAVEGAVSPGEVLFIMGGSGAGKSMLLDALADRLSMPVRGQVHLFGLPKASERFRGMARYVQQDDVMYASLTTKETLEYAASFAGVPSTKLREVVDKALQVLGLETAANIRVGGRFFRGLSGGQRRRLSVGCQLVSKPTLLLCDEVMSGLDSTAALRVMEHLREVADAGSAVICSVHTPSAAMFALSDSLCLLSRGRVAYFGPSAEVDAYFTEKLGMTLPPRQSVAEWVISLCNPDFSASSASLADTICSAWPDSDARVRLLSRIAGRDVSALWETAVRSSSTTIPDPLENLDLASAPDMATVAELRQGCACGIGRQTWLLTKRSLVDALRNPGVVWIRLVVHLGLAVIIGLAWFRRRTTTAAHLFDLLGLLFFIQTFYVQASLSVLPIYVEEKEIVARERANQMYGLVAYTTAHLFVEATFLFFLSSVSSTIIFFLCGLNSHFERYVFFVGMQWLSLLTTESLILFIAAVTPVSLVGLASAAFVLALFTVVQGFVIKMEHLGPLRVLRWVSLNGYALSALFSNELHGRTFAASPNTWPPYPADVDGDVVLATFEFPTLSRFVACGALVAMLVFYRTATFAWIWTFHNGKK